MPFPVHSVILECPRVCHSFSFLGRRIPQNLMVLKQNYCPLAFPRKGEGPWSCFQSSVSQHYAFWTHQLSRHLDDSHQIKFIGIRDQRWSIGQKIGSLMLQTPLLSKHQAVSLQIKSLVILPIRSIFGCP